MPPVNFGDGLCAADGSVSQTAKTAGTPADDNFINLFRRLGDESDAGGVPGPPDWPAEVTSECVVYRVTSPGAGVAKRALQLAVPPQALATGKGIPARAWPLMCPMKACLSATAGVRQRATTCPSSSYPA